MINPPQPSFWVFIEPMVSDEIKTQLMALRDSESDVMKCRSWLRIMLNKSLLLSFLEDLQRHPGLLSFHYGGESVLRDAERLEIVIQLLRGLSTIQLGYDSYNLGQLCATEGRDLAGLIFPKHQERRRESESTSDLVWSGCGQHGSRPLLAVLISLSVFRDPDHLQIGSITTGGRRGTTRS
jgi:hypothetical protein